MTHSQRLPVFQLPLLGLIAGIIFQSWYPLSFLALCIPGGCAGTALFFVPPRFTRALLIFTFFLLGATTFQLQKNYHKSQLTKYFSQHIDIVGLVTNKEAIDSYPYNQRLTIAVTNARKETDFYYRPETFTLHLYTKNNHNVVPGDTIKLKRIFIQSFDNKTLSGNPTFNDYLIKEHVLATVFTTKKISCWKRPYFSWRRLLWEKRDHLYQTLKNKLSKLSSLYFSLMFLGNKQQKEKEALRRTFNFWGIAHYLARSGLHIVLFIVLWKFLLSFIPMHLILKKFLLILLCLLYSFLSWPSLSFLRAYNLFILFQVGSLLGRQTHFLHLLSLFSLILLLLNPYQLFFLDFQLSFGLTFAIVWLATQSKNKIT